MSAKVSGVDRQ